jgi:hypothetical protein
VNTDVGTRRKRLKLNRAPSDPAEPANRVVVEQ